jgi:hypothetical protein
VVVLAGQASPVQCLVTLTATVTLVQTQRGPHGVGDLVVALAVGLVVGSVVVGEGGDFTDTLGDKF